MIFSLFGKCSRLETGLLLSLFIFSRGNVRGRHGSRENQKIFADFVKPFTNFCQMGSASPLLLLQVFYLDPVYAACNAVFEITFKLKGPIVQAELIKVVCPKTVICTAYYTPRFFSFAFHSLHHVREHSFLEMGELL